MEASNYQFIKFDHGWSVFNNLDGLVVGKIEPTHTGHFFTPCLCIRFDVVCLTAISKFIQDQDYASDME